MDFIKEIIRQNGFWDSGTLEITRLSGNWVRREIEPILNQSIKSKFITVIKGLRSTGKSSLAKRIIQKNLQEGENPQSIGWFEFDRAMNANHENMDNIINYFISKNVSKIFFDEIHFVSMWQDVLKRFYDRTNLKFVVTGSSALELDSRSAESLAGRINLIEVKPFNFKEYLNFKNIDITSESELIKNENIIIQYAESFILSGGFPEVVKFENPIEGENFIRNAILDPVFYKDMPVVTGFNPDLLTASLSVLSSSVSSTFQTKSISELLGISYPNAVKSIQSLEKSLVVKVVYNQTKSLIKKSRVSKKIIFNDNGILKTLNKDISIGKLAENNAAVHFTPQEFYRDSEGREIDWLLPDKKIAVEIKYSDNISKYEIRHLEYFLSKNPEWKGIISSKSIENKINEIRIIPYWKLMLEEF